MEPKQPTFSIRVVPGNGCTACCHGAIMLHPGLGDENGHPNGMKLKQKPDGSCIYLNDHNCSIWPNTPAVCRVFDCGAYVRAGLHLRDPLRDEAVTAAGTRLGTCFCPRPLFAPGGLKERGLKSRN